MLEPTVFNSSLIHYIVTALSVIVPCISVGIGQGLVGSAACKALNIQPSAKDDITNTALLSITLMEMACITGILIALLLGLEPVIGISEYVHIGQIGIALALCLVGACVGYFSSYPAQESCLAIARQPFAASWIFRFNLFVLSIMQTPLVFGFIIAWLIKGQAFEVTTLTESLRLIAAGGAIGLGCIGPIWGMGLLTRTAAKGVGINRNASESIMSFTFIGQTIIETPIIFALLISILLLFYKTTDGSLISAIAMLAASVATGLGMLNPGINAGRVARSAVEQITYNPMVYTQVLKLNIVAEAFINTNAIYALLVSLLLIILF